MAAQAGTLPGRCRRRVGRRCRDRARDTGGARSLAALARFRRNASRAMLAESRLAERTAEAVLAFSGSPGVPGGAPRLAARS